MPGAELGADAGAVLDGMPPLSESERFSRLADEVCDGRDGLALASYLKPDFGQLGDAAVATELGAGFLYLDGHCRYWVWDTGEYLDAFRTGSLSRTDLIDLLRAWSFDHWAAFSRRWDYFGGFHVGYQVFYSRKHGFACQGPCPEAPVGAAAAAEAAIEWRSILWERSQPMTDVAMRVAPFMEEPDNVPALYGQTPIPWPFAVSPREMTLWRNSPFEPGTGYVVTDASEIEAIRLERENARVRTGSQLYFGPYEGRYQVLNAREVLPFENDVGLIPEPDFVAEFWTR